MNWTPELVLARFIEAADTEWRSPRAVLGPRPAPAFWPEYVHSEADQKGWGRHPGHQLLPGDDPITKINKTKVARALPSADAISRMDEVLAWGLEMLSHDERKALWAYSFAIVSGRSFSRWCQKNGVVRRTAYRRFNKAIETIAASLCKNDVFLRLPDIERVSQLCFGGGIKFSDLAVPRSAMA